MTVESDIDMASEEDEPMQIVEKIKNRKANKTKAIKKKI